MNAAPLEIEAKFAVPDLGPIRGRLRQRRAEAAAPAVREVNLRFDFPDGRLQRDGRVLRLRKDRQARLTVKSPGADPEHRHEIEVIVDRAEAAEALLASLDFQVFFVYEKIREIFLLDGAHIMLDQMPFGSFVEIEGASLDVVQRAAEAIGLPWTERLPLPYLALFERLRSKKGWGFRDATFDNFAGLPPASIQELRSAGSEP